MYIPRPFDLADISLYREAGDVCHLLAENFHAITAQNESTVGNSSSSSEKLAFTPYSMLTSKEKEKSYKKAEHLLKFLMVGLLLKNGISCIISNIQA